MARDQAMVVTIRATVILFASLSVSAADAPYGWHLVLKNYGGHAPVGVEGGTEALYFSHEPIRLQLHYEIGGSARLAGARHEQAPELDGFLRKTEIRYWRMAEPQKISVVPLEEMFYESLSLSRQGKVREVAMKEAWSEPSPLRPGDVVTIDLVLADLPVGDWVIHATQPASTDWDGRHSQKVGVSVRQGTESPELRARYLKERRLTDDAENFRALTMELMELSPDDWTLWKDLGFWAVNYGDTREAVQYFAEARARRLSDRRPLSTLESMQLDLMRRFAEVREVFDRGRWQDGRRFGLSVRVVDGAYVLAWLDLASGLTINELDPDDPRPDLEALERSLEIARSQGSLVDRSSARGSPDRSWRRVRQTD